MKSQKLTIAIAMGIAVLISVAGCKKNKDKQTVCRINSGVVSPGETYHFLYNNDGRLEKLTYGANVSLYNYTPGTTTITGTAAGVFFKKTIATLNATGLATNVRVEYNTTGSSWVNFAHEYNGEELVKSVSTDSSGRVPFTTTYTWANHNIVKSTAAGTVVTEFEYYTDRPIQDGDFSRIQQFIQGYETARTRNLLKSQFPIIYSYEFNSGGKITSASAGASGSSMPFSTISYQYDCN